MADFTHSFTYEAGVLRIFDNATGAQVVEQPHNPNTGFGWASEEAAMTYGQREFHHLYQQEIPSLLPPVEDTTTPVEPEVIDTISTSTTVGTGE